MTDEPLPPGDTIEEPLPADVAATAVAEAAEDAAPAPAPAPETQPDAGVEATSTRRPAGLELYLLRHADAGDPLEWEGDDAERPLSGKGRKQARRVGRWLADLGRRPDAILTSPKVRALETATIVGASVGVKPKIEPRLGEPLDERVLDEILTSAAHAGHDVRRVMLVGHDPDFSVMASSLAGGPIALKKGALARIDLDGSTGPATGSLRWLIPAEAVPDR